MTQPRPIPLAARLVALATTIVFSGMGLVAAWTEHHAGRTKQGALLVLDGPVAVSFGLGLALFGLMPLALWMRTPRAAGWWAAVTMIGGVGLMLFG